MSNNVSLLQALDFPKPIFVEGRVSIADLYKPRRRCGVYVLHFSNDEWYCGQAVDVTRRLVQHTKNHPDIAEIQFKEVATEYLNQVERDCIHHMEAAKYKMRNITFMSVIEGETDFDLIMSVEDQKTWLKMVNRIIPKRANELKMSHQEKGIRVHIRDSVR